MNRYLIAIFMILLIISGGVYYYNSSDTGIDVSDRQFAVKDSEDIHKVFIAHRDGDSFVLERKKGSWVLDGKYSVFNNAITNLLEVLTRMEIQYIPTNAAVPNIVRDLASLGVKVEVYGKRGEKLRSFYVGGTDPSGRSTYMIVEGKNQPYAMYIPTWEGSLRERFLLKQNDWRDRVVFAYEPQDIQSVQVTYPRAAAAGFVLERSLEKPEEFVVEKIIGTSLGDASPLKGAIQNFLIGFEHGGAESIESANKNREAIVEKVPYCIIEITRTNGSLDSLRIWPYNQVEEKIDFSEEFIAIGPFRYFVEKNGNELFLMQLPKLEKILVSYDYFFRIPRD